MIVGVTAVFAILLLVIGMGKCLISLVNKYTSEEVLVKTDLHTVATEKNDALPSSAMAAIVSAVSVLTSGQGRVIKIEKNKI